MSLTELPALLREEPAVAQVLGRSSAVLAVPDPARALTLAGLATISSRRPLLAAVPTTADAERLAHDLATFLGDDGSSCSRRGRRCRSSGSAPAVETMGRRLRTLWRLHDPDRCPAVVVAPVRALVQRLGPGSDTRRAPRRPPLAAGRPRRARRLAGRRRLPPRAAGRAPRRGGGPRLDRRRVPVDRRRPDPHRPLGRRGRPAHRVLGQRPALHDRPRRGRDLPVPRAAARTTTSGLAPRSWWGPSRGAASSGSAWPRARCSTAWSPGCRGSWTTSGSCSTCCRRRPSSCSSSPAGCATGPATCWPRRPTSRRPSPGPGASPPTTRDGAPATLPRLHVAFDRLLAHTEVPVWSVTVTPEGPDVATVGAMGWNPVVGDGATLVKQLRDLLADGYRIMVAADGEGSAQRLGALLRDQGVELPVAVGALERGCILTGAEAGGAGRARPHRPPPRPPRTPASQARHRRVLRRPEDRRLRRPPPARRGQLRRHGEAGHRWRRAGLPAARVPRQRQALRPERPDRRRPPLHRRRQPEPVQARRGRLAEGQGPGPQRGARRSPRSWWCSTRSGSTRPATPSPRTRPGSASWRRPSRTRRRPTRTRRSPT